MVVRTHLHALSLGLLLLASPVAASPAQEQARACVQASTDGQTARDEGRLRAARERLLACVRESCPGIVREHCATWLAEVERRIPSVVIRVVRKESALDLPDARVRIDGVPVALDGRPVALDPGVHAIAAFAAGMQEIERKFLLAEREQARLLIVELSALEVSAPTSSAPRRADALPPAEPREQRFAPPLGAWVLGGVGLASLGTFAILGSLAARERDELERSCAPYCSATQRRAGENMARAADIFLGVGAAGLVGSGAWSLGAWLRRGRTARAHVALWPTRHGAIVALDARY